jgi:hypothetical protein
VFPEIVPLNVPLSVPDVVPEIVPETVPEMVPELFPETVPEIVPPAELAPPTQMPFTQRLLAHSSLLSHGDPGGSLKHWPSTHRLPGQSLLSEHSGTHWPLTHRFDAHWLLLVHVFPALELPAQTPFTQRLLAHSSLDVHGEPGGSLKQIPSTQRLPGQSPLTVHSGLQLPLIHRFDGHSLLLLQVGGLHSPLTH